MRDHDCRASVLVAALILLQGARGDEPTKPTASATEANPAVPAAGHSVHGEAFNDGPRHAAYLMPGMGKVHFPVTTAKPEAQAFIDQGVAQLHSFYYFEAERSFRQAAKIDPDCAMAYWGMAMANVNNAKRAKEFLKEARKRDGQAHPPREALPRRARGASTRRAATTRTGEQDHLLGLETIVQEFPDDIDARAWLAMVTWQNGGDGIGSRQAVDTVHRHGPPGRADAPRGAPLPHPPLGRRQADPRREVGRRSTPRPRPGSPTPGTCRATPTPG